MSWHAIVPLKPPGRRKTRLADMLDADARDRLSEAMLAHVLAVLHASPHVATTQVLADEARGLNAELAAARDPSRPTLVLFPDLPELTVADLDALLAAPAAVALAPDRTARGTNAVAIRDDRAFAYAFGPDSLARHRALAPDAAIVRRDALARDIDTPGDLAAWGGWAG